MWDREPQQRKAKPREPTGCKSSPPVEERTIENGWSWSSQGRCGELSSGSPTLRGRLVDSILHRMASAARLGSIKKPAGRICVEPENEAIYHFEVVTGHVPFPPDVVRIGSHVRIEDERAGANCEIVIWSAPVVLTPHRDVNIQPRGGGPQKGVRPCEIVLSVP